MITYIFLALGIILAQFKLVSPLIALYACGISFVTIIAIRLFFPSTRYFYKIIALSIILFIFGFSYGNLRIDYRIKNTLTLGHNLSANGYLISVPESYDNYVQAKFYIADGIYKNQTIILNYSNIRQLKTNHAYQLNIALVPINKASNIANFDAAQQAINQDIFARGYLNKIDNDLGKTYHPSTVINTFRYNLINYLHKTLVGYTYQGFIIALATGYQKFIPQEQWQIFKNSGIMHIVSISGLHITIISGVFVLLLLQIYRFLPLINIPKQIVITWLAILVAWVYALIAGFSIPTQRAFYLMLVIAILRTSRLNIPTLQKLAIAFCVVLLIDPFAALSAGFWMSFFMVGGIFFIANQINQDSKIKQWLKMQLYVNLISFPLSMYLFGVFAPISILANLIAIPIIGNLLTPLALISSLLHLNFLIHLSANLLYISMIPIKLMSTVGSYQQILPNLATLFLCYIGITLLIIPRSLPYKNILGVILFGSIFMTNDPLALSHNTSQSVILNHHQIGINVYETKNNTALILYIPTQAPAQAINLTSLVNYLNARKITTINYLFINQDKFSSDIIELLAQQHIVVQNINPEFANFNFTQIEANYQNNLMNIMITESNHILLFSDGIAPKSQAADSLVYYTNNSKLAPWVYNFNLHNLIINTTMNNSKTSQNILDNINLPNVVEYSINKHGSVIIDTKNNVHSYQETKGY